ncbi:hypothetical protein DV515_00012947 [Chloebia gouldiae]|uniref:Uncharacterized protein n=1 Tax=Chloebia gouldiae TaxID=44316 RepID=A0A3L8S267_CHLGU|nr:hypothetical protein DV515_00012947 [Chloebia gouldiae]
MPKLRDPRCSVPGIPSSSRTDGRTDRRPKGVSQEGSCRAAGISAPMDKGLHFTICVVTAVLLLRESSQAGAGRNDDAVGKVSNCSVSPGIAL